MDALGPPPGLARSDRYRKSPDFLPAYNDILLLGDVLGGIFLGYVSGCLYLRFEHPNLGLMWSLSREVMLGSIIAALVLREPRLAVDHELFAPRRVLTAMIWRAIAAMTIVATIGLITRGFGDTVRLWVVAWCAFFFVYACLGRLAIVAYLHRLAMRGVLREAVAVLGAPDVAGRLAERIAENAAVVRVIDNFELSEPDASASDAVAELLELARAGVVDTVILAMGATQAADARPIVQRLKSVPVQVVICADVDAPAIAQRKLRLLSSVPMSVVADRPLERRALLAKTAIDKIGAAVLLIVGGPLMVIAALAVALDSPGPVIFRQRRSGWGGRLFTIYKFRTMRHTAHVLVERQTVRNDPRCTRVGVFLRRASIDELPQLWNVLCGDMSLVGPRPHADLLHLTEPAGCKVVADYAQRYRVKPGLTGWAQIHGSRGAATTPEAIRRRIAYDLYYIDNWSLWLDVQILARTPWILLGGENAY